MNANAKTKIAKDAVIVEPLALFDEGDVAFIHDALDRSDSLTILIDGYGLRRDCARRAIPHALQIKAYETLFASEIARNRLRVIAIRLDPYERNPNVTKASLWRQTAVDAFHPKKPSNATAIAPLKRDGAYTRRLLPWLPTIDHDIEAFADKTPTILDPFSYDCPKELASWRDDIVQNAEFEQLTVEYGACQAYKKSWEPSPYPPTFNAADLVIRCAGEDLYIRRDKHPYLDAICFPGGHLEPNETLYECALREGKEETGFSIDELNTYFVSEKTFDAPYRDPRGRYISQAFFFNLPHKKAPKVKGRDDAKEAFWSAKTPFLNEFGFDHAFYLSHLDPKSKAK